MNDYILNCISQKIDAINDAKNDIEEHKKLSAPLQTYIDSKIDSIKTNSLALATFIKGMQQTAKK